jgi:hypothetical protein
VKRDPFFTRRDQHGPEMTIILLLYWYLPNVLQKAFKALVQIRSNIIYEMF